MDGKEGKTNYSFIIIESSFAYYTLSGEGIVVYYARLKEHSTILSHSLIMFCQPQL